MAITEFNILLCFYSVNLVVFAGGEETGDPEKLKILFVEDLPFEDQHIVDQLDTHVESLGFYSEFPGNLD